MPTNTKVLIRVITLNNSNSRGHEFGDTGHVSLPPLDRLDFILNIQLLCFDYQQVQFPELIVVLGIFYQYLLCFQPKVLCYTVTRKSPQKLPVLDLLPQISKEWEDFF